MNSSRIKLWLILFFLGLIGILSLLFINHTLPPEVVEHLAGFSDFQVRLLLLVNPFILFLLFCTLGVLLYPSTGLRLPVFDYNRSSSASMGDVLLRTIRFGTIAGVIAGVSLLIIHWAFTPLISDELGQMEAHVQVPFITRILYGGITEEIVSRFGLMTAIIWLLIKLFRHSKKWMYLSGILLSAFLFACGHLPILFQSIPNPSSEAVIFILVGNSIGGIIFGFCYWRMGLAAAMIAHMAAHILLYTLT